MGGAGQRRVGVEADDLARNHPPAEILRRIHQLSPQVVAGDARLRARIGRPPFDEQTDAGADVPLGEVVRQLGGERPEGPGAFFLHQRRDAVGKIFRKCPRPGGEAEDVEVARGFLRNLQRPGEVGVGLAGEADHDIETEPQARYFLLRIPDVFQGPRGGVRPVHPLQDGIGAGLERDVEVRGDSAPRGGYAVHQPPCQLVGFDGGQAQSFEAGGFEERPQKVRQFLTRFVSPGAQVHAGQHDLPVPGGD